MYVTIPEIGVQVMFSGLIFSVEVPFSKFANNTEGQCGEALAGDPRPRRAPPSSSRPRSSPALAPRTPPLPAPPGFPRPRPHPCPPRLRPRPAFILP